MEPFDLLKTQVAELTDFDPATISLDTQLEELNLASLDYVSIQVAVKKAYGIHLALDRLPEQKLSTVGDFVRYLASLRQDAPSTAMAPLN